MNIYSVVSLDVPRGSCEQLLEAPELGGLRPRGCRHADPERCPSKSRRASASKDAGAKGVVGTVPQADAQGRESRMRRGTSQGPWDSLTAGGAGPGGRSQGLRQNKDRNSGVCVCLCAPVLDGPLF